MEAKQVPYLEFACIEFILCLPGTSAPAERVFSSVKNTWKIESSQLSMKSLKARLFVKMNLDYSCIEFFHFLKTQPQLLRKISSQEKYNFKQSTAATPNTSLMSVESEQSNLNETTEMDSV